MANDGGSQLLDRAARVGAHGTGMNVGRSIMTIRPYEDKSRLVPPILIVS